MAELGLTLEPSYTAIDLPPAWGARRGRRGRRAGALDGRRRRAPTSRALEAGVRPARAHRRPGGSLEPPEAERLDRLSVGAWLRSRRARPGAIRYLDHMQRSLSIDSVERTSLLGAAAQGGGRRRRTASTTRAAGSTCAWRRDRPRWRCAWPTSWASALRLGSVVVARSASTGSRCTAFLRDGERIEAEAVVCALPVGTAARRDGERRLGGAAATRSTASAARSPPRPWWPTRARSGTSAARPRTAIWAPSGSSATASSRRSRRPSGSGPCSPRPSRCDGDEFLDFLASLMGDAALDPILYGTRALGRRSVHAGLRDRLARRAT